jgi:hypothetical protein
VERAFVFSANGAASLTAWGNAPGLVTDQYRALKARLKSNEYFSARIFTLGDHRNESRLQRSRFEMDDPWGVAPGYR